MADKNADNEATRYLQNIELGPLERNTLSQKIQLLHIVDNHDQRPLLRSALKGVPGPPR